MQLTDITDLSRAMFNVIQRDTLTNLLMPNQKYLAMSQIFREARRGFAGLTGQFDLLTDDNGAARSVGLEDEDVFREKDGVQFGTFTMRHTDTSWLYHRYAVLSNRDDKAKIYEYLRSSAFRRWPRCTSSMSRCSGANRIRARVRKTRTGFCIRCAGMPRHRR